MERHACRYCIASRGLKGSEIDTLPKTEEELFEHIEREHHIPVAREGETEEETLARFTAENPEAADPATCRCPGCCARRELGEALRGGVTV